MYTYSTPYLSNAYIGGGRGYHIAFVVQECAQDRQPPGVLPADEALPRQQYHPEHQVCLDTVFATAV